MMYLGQLRKKPRAVESKECGSVDVFVDVDDA